MDGLTTITTKGQVTIPEKVRQALHIKVGDKVSFTRVLPHYKEAVIKIIPKKIVEQLLGSLSSDVKETDYRKVRKSAGKLLLKKYKLK